MTCKLDHHQADLRGSDSSSADQRNPAGPKGASGSSRIVCPPPPPLGSENMENIRYSSRDSISADTSQSPMSREVNDHQNSNFVFFRTTYSPKDRKSETRDASPHLVRYDRSSISGDNNNEGDSEENDSLYDEPKMAKLRAETSVASTFVTSQPNLLVSSNNSQIFHIMEKRKGVRRDGGAPDLVDSEQFHVARGSVEKGTKATHERAAPKENDSSEMNLVREPLKGTMKAKILGNNFVVDDSDDDISESTKEKIIEEQLKGFCEKVKKERNTASPVMLKPVPMSPDAKAPAAESKAPTATRKARVVKFQQNDAATKPIEKEPLPPAKSSTATSRPHKTDDVAVPEAPQHLLLQPEDSVPVCVMESQEVLPSCSRQRKSRGSKSDSISAFFIKKGPNGKKRETPEREDDDKKELVLPCLTSVECSLNFKKK
ncbi:hypothetical protein, conserved [Angomonas deanei]|uniref:Uncharacterized protein n=1 Tax=Angomonas deanei TaxID=59799 RepID=A0A7G2CNG5_9TRYP|nr:hypothetical protein, conserved [Angomonas deanei]